MRSDLLGILPLLGFAAMALICGLLVWPQLTAALPCVQDKIDRFRRMPPFAKLLLLVFVGAFVVYGSTKTNLVDQTSGTNVVEIVEGGTNDVEIIECGTNEVEIVDSDATNTPPMMLTMVMPFSNDQPPTVTPEDIARGWQQVEVRTNCNISYAMSEGATLATNWWVRGAYEDVKPFNFGNWRFPFGTNEYSSLWAFSWGKIRFTLADTNTEIVAVGAPMSAVPYRSRLWLATDTNGARVVTWENFVLGRERLPAPRREDASGTVNAQVELRANGDFITRSNEVETVYRYIDPFDNDGDGILDDEDWDPWCWDGDFTGQPNGWAEYVDEVVGTGQENGYYKLTATFPSGYFRRTVLSVGDERIVVADPGKYVFLLEKGNEYEIGLEPFVEGVEFDAVDDIPVADGLMRSQMAPQGRWEGKWTRDEGRLCLTPPLMSIAGWIMWTPKLCVSPDTWSPSAGDPSETFTAMFFDRTDMMESPTSYSWTSPNNSVDFGSSTRVTTLATWQMGAQDTIAAHLTVSFGLLQLESTLAFEYVEEGEGSNPNVVCWMEELPDTLFLNNDNDLGNPEADYWYCDVGDDDVPCATIRFSSSVPTNGTIRIENLTGYTGSVYAYDDYWQIVPVFAGQTWTLHDESERSIPLYFNASGKSSGFETSQIKVRWIPEVGQEKTFVNRFTVVEPVAEPVCADTKAMTENGETRNVAYNPCGVAVGHDAYYKIEVKPTAYPDSMIAWETSGEGSVQFVGGNRGREIRVRGVSPGDVTLSAKLGNSVSSPPSFTFRVVTNRTIRLSAWIVGNAEGKHPRSESDIRDMVKTANDIYAQVGVTFDLGDRITVTNIPAAYDINEFHETEGHWNLGRLTALASGTGGLECYFVHEIIDDAPNARSDSPIVGIHSNSGLAVAAAGNGVTLAHEIGHAFGLNDIYNETRSGVELMGFVSEDMMVQDWNGGSGGDGQSGARYYPFGKFRRDLVRDLLMDGWKVDIGKGIDIPFGAIKGYNLQGEDDFVFVGFFYPPTLQSPTHQ